jgi:hypothetical protein
MVAVTKQENGAHLITVVNDITLTLGIYSS